MAKFTCLQLAEKCFHPVQTGLNKKGGTITLQRVKKNRRNDSFRFRAVGRLEADQSQEDVAVSLKVALEWSLASRINSKHVVLSVEGTAKFATEHQHLNRIATLLEVPEKVDV
ncbi:hypothetical protein TNCV_4349741 [Trichonephila clavipes]|nr:hypothetical protein TNCV_4349741 [Trichonephila clavipes]